MRFITVIGQRWKRAAGTSLTIALLSAVSVVGFTVLGSKVLTACKAAGNAEQALASGNSLGLLSFEAPQANVAQFKTKAEEGELVKNWKFTDSPALDSILSKNFLLDYALVTNPNSPLPIVPGVSLSFNQISSNPFLSPFANLIAMSGALYALGTFLEQDHTPAVTNFVNATVNQLTLTNAVVAAFVKAILNALNAAVTSFVNFLRATQIAINNLIPPNFRPPTIPPASPSS